ncbi:hypothetical protein FXO37_19001 [Capsicum annuum]|nr:hypothetical protein FXO37_19001 [Capsicum annuum]
MEIKNMRSGGGGPSGACKFLIKNVDDALRRGEEIKAVVAAMATKAAAAAMAASPVAACIGRRCSDGWDGAGSIDGCMGAISDNDGFVGEGHRPDKGDGYEGDKNKAEGFHRR